MLIYWSGETGIRSFLATRQTKAKGNIFKCSLSERWFGICSNLGRGQVKKDTKEVRM